MSQHNGGASPRPAHPICARENGITEVCERYELKRAAVDQHKARLAARLAVTWAGVLAASLCVLTRSDSLRVVLLGAATSLLLTALEAKNLTDEIDKLDTMEAARTDGPGRRATRGRLAAPRQQGGAPARKGQPRRRAPAAEHGRRPGTEPQHRRAAIAAGAEVARPRPQELASEPISAGTSSRTLQTLQKAAPKVLHAGGAQGKRAVKLASGLRRGESFSWVGLGSLTRHLPSSPLPPIDELQVASFA
jgi:hypothetical protein